MRANSMLLAVAVLHLQIATAHESSKNDPDQVRILGKWKVTQVHSDGKVRQAEKGAEFEFKKNTAVVKPPDQEARAGMYKLDSKMNPKQMDWTTERDGERRVRKLLYSLDGNVLKICRKGAGVERPSEISAKPGSEHFILVLKRIPKTK